MTITPQWEELYRADPDPWEVASSWYERRKIAVTLAMLQHEWYGLVWDAACGTGHLALELAARAERVVATDVSAEACRLAEALVQREGAEVGARVTVEQSALPNRPEALRDLQPDLVVLSEVLYYLDEGERAATWRLLDEVCTDRTDVVAVHWMPEPEQAYLTGAAVQRELNAHLGERGWYRLVTHTDTEFVAALWSPRPPEQFGR